MGILNQWKVISLTEDANTALKKGEYSRCRALLKEAYERVDKESHSSFPLNWEYYEKLAAIKGKLFDKTGIWD